MAETSKIEWTDATWNVAVGCDKVSAGCANCYMYDYMRRYGRDPRVVTRTSPGVFNLPLRKNRDGSWKVPDGSKVFTSSLTDFFHEDIDAFRDEAWAIIRRRPGLIFQVLTKRPERIAAHLPTDWGAGYPNVWLGATVENQDAADVRVPVLARVPAAVRFLSVEPMIGPVDLAPWLESIDHCRNCDEEYPAHPRNDVCPGCGQDQLITTWGEEQAERYRTSERYMDNGPSLADDGPQIHWVIVGGESGPGARIMHPNWARSVRDQCTAAGVPFLFKQWGEWDAVTAPGTEVLMARLPSDVRVSVGDGKTNHTRHRLVGKRAAGRLLDGRTWDEFPGVSP